MLERPVIQQRGFRNIEHDGDIVGFQVPIRLEYYRGVWMSQVRPITVTIDDQVFTGDQIQWHLNGKIYEQKDLANLGDIHWSNNEPMMLCIKKDGGLSPGSHHIKLHNQFSASYLPPRLDLCFFGKPAERTMVLVR